MALDLRNTLVIGISASALFDLREADAVFQSQGIRAYRDHMQSLENTPLTTGTGFALVAALLSLNAHGSPGGALTDVEVWCDQSTDGGGWTLIQRTVRDWTETSLLLTG